MFSILNKLFIRKLYKKPTLDWKPIIDDKTGMFFCRPITIDDKTDHQEFIIIDFGLELNVLNT
jgi:hypothetical protein